MRGWIVAVVTVVVAASAAAQPHPRPAPAPPAPATAVPVTPWVSTSCWVEARWFDSLRNGPVDYCKRSLRYRPGQLDCLTFTDQVCWAVNRDTGDWTQLRALGDQTLFPCPYAPEPPTCPRLR
jgi:hypothetical protein